MFVPLFLYASAFSVIMLEKIGVAQLNVVFEVVFVVVVVFVFVILDSNMYYAFAKKSAEFWRILFHKIYPFFRLAVRSGFKVGLNR